MTSLDPRLNAYRDDLADERLRDLVTATRYVEGDDAHVHVDSLPLFLEPSFDMELQTEALYGDGVRVFEIRDGWAWGQLVNDGYVGYVPLDGLSPGLKTISHKISSLRSFIYSKADIKSPPVALVSMLSGLNVVGKEGEFYELDDGTYVHKSHAVHNDEYLSDFVAVAERFVGTPYLWGGRTSLGLDCSALVQLSLAATNIKVPRDSRVQEREIGIALDDKFDLSQLIRGDFVFWTGHIGTMVDRTMILHANAFHMEVAREPLITAIERIKTSGGGEITAIRRLGLA